MRMLRGEGHDLALPKMPEETSATTEAAASTGAPTATTQGAAATDSACPPIEYEGTTCERKRLRDRDQDFCGDSSGDQGLDDQGYQLYSAAAGAAPAVSEFVGQESIASTADRPADLLSVPSGGEAAPRPRKRRRLRGKQVPPLDAGNQASRDYECMDLPRALSLPAARDSQAARRAAALPGHAAAAHGRPPEPERRGPPCGLLHDASVA